MVLDLHYQLQLVYIDSYRGAKQVLQVEVKADLANISLGYFEGLIYQGGIYFIAV